MPREVRPRRKGRRWYDYGPDQRFLVAFAATFFWIGWAVGYFFS
jgi:hypothetical protein